MMLRIWRLPEQERLGNDLSSLRVAFHMAAPCAPWLKSEWIGWLGPEKILELYGGTEFQAMTVITGTEWLEHEGSVGKAVIGEIECRDPDGRPERGGHPGRVSRSRRARPGRPTPGARAIRCR